MVNTACPNVKFLKEHAECACAFAEVEELARHLEECDRCGAIVESYLARNPAFRAAATGDYFTAGDMQCMEKLIGRLQLALPTARSEAGGEHAIPHAAEENYDLLAPPRAPGELGWLGPYRVLEVLGSGGMGVVFRAVDPALRRPVALKAMKPALAAKTSARERFLREARAAAALKHDHVVTIHQVGEDRGVPYLAMELLEGESLADRLTSHSGLLPNEEIVRIGREIALSLSAAHAKGLIHRDVKPPNIWLERTHAGSARVKLLDFGLVRESDDPSSLSHPGTLLGTPAYMAPEQASSGVVDARSDLFSLGCVLYHLATGREAFAGKNNLDILLAVRSSVPPAPDTLNPSLPRELSNLIQRLLSKHPDDRPQSAQYVVDALDAIGATARPLARPLSPRSYGFIVAAILLLGLGVLTFLYGGTIFRFVTDRGELVIEVNDPTAEITVKQNGVIVHDRTARREFVIAAGNGEVEVYEKDGVKLATREFTLTRGGVTTVRVTSPGKTPAAPTGTKGTDLLANSGAKAVAWLQEQTVFGPDSEVVKDATTHIATARTLGHGIIVKLGPGLIKSQKQTWLCVRAGGFFVFELTPEQDKNSAIRERGLVTDQTEGDDAPRRDPPAATVLSLKLDQATALPADEQATGKVSFKVPEKCEGHFALRFSIQVEDLHHTRYCQLDRLENDAVDFSFPALKKGTGTAVMFVDVVSFAGADRSGPVTVRSNAIAQLVHIGPSKGEKK